MNLFTGEAADSYFGGEPPPAVRALLRQAAEARADERGALLWTAQALAPQHLATYYVIYKHHAGRREFVQAERAARRALQEAARQAGIDDAGRRPDGGAADFRSDGPARFWLFTLKALAFITLRGGRPQEARALLARIQAVEPDARLGDEVVASLLREAERFKDGS